MYKFRKGEIIHEDEPYASAVDSKLIKATCSYCFGNSGDLFCQGCHVLKYCSSECLTKDKCYHEIECRVLGKMAACELPDAEFRLVVRALAREVTETDQGWISVGEFFGCNRSIKDLLSHVEKLSTEQRETAMTKVNTIHDLIKSHLSVSLDDVLEMLQKCRVNTHAILDFSHSRVVTRGSAVYLAASKTNHSCEVNEDYVQVFEGKNIILRAIRDFTVTDPNNITVHYMPPMLTYKERQKRCRTNYHFECNCKKCRSDKNEEIAACSEQLASEMREAFAGATKVRTWYRLGLRFLSRMAHLPLTDYYVFWMNVQLQVCGLELNLQEESIYFGLRALSAAQSWISQETILYNLYRAQVGLGWRDSADHSSSFKATMILARKYARRAHGKDHPVVDELRRNELTGCK